VHTKALNVTNYMEVSRFRGVLAKDVFVDSKLLAKASIRAGPASLLEPVGSHHEGSPVNQASQA